MKSIYFDIFWITIMFTIAGLDLFTLFSTGFNFLAVIGAVCCTISGIMSVFTLFFKLRSDYSENQ